ncbi:MAG TPA: pilus assembly protein TadG-related protein, partial [Gaiellales bacterium]|nr:pilus assembly protein TadG-related protein [Gaiellales bacterium]
MSARSPKSGQRGQVLALCALFLVVLMGFATMAIDAGSWYMEKRKLQSAADAAALAGASQLPAGFGTAQSTANSYFTKNKDTGDAAVITNTTTYAANDSVHVVATGTAPSFFAKVFGHAFVNLKADATASVRSVTSYTSSGDVMPLVVMQNSYTPGQTYTIYGDGSSSNNGAVDLNVV